MRRETAMGNNIGVCQFKCNIYLIFHLLLLKFGLFLTSVNFYTHVEHVALYQLSDIKTKKKRIREWKFSMGDPIHL